jgi:hypothetical protein
MSFSALMNTMRKKVSKMHLTSEPGFLLHHTVWCTWNTKKTRYPIGLHFHCHVDKEPCPEQRPHFLWEHQKDTQRWLSLSGSCSGDCVVSQAPPFSRNRFPSQQGVLSTLISTVGWLAGGQQARRTGLGQVWRWRCGSVHTMCWPHSLYSSKGEMAIAEEQAT